MTWKNVKLIFRREMRDQLRDRRTLFMIAVLPVLFYPLLGVSFFQIAQFLREHPSRVLILGYESTTTNLPELIKDDQFAKDVMDDVNSKSELVELEFKPLRALPFVRDAGWPPGSKLDVEQLAVLHMQVRELMNRHRCEAAVCFPPTFFAELETYPERFREHAQTAAAAGERPPEMPKPVLIYDHSNDKKRLAHFRVTTALDEWSKQVGRKSLEDSNLGRAVAQPIEFTRQNVAEDEARINTSLWSKILPFVLMIWAVTGAFYPAVDLCAGEKERGTLETLLTSPARRVEIVLGKLFTIMLFSIATAVLNLISMGITGAVVMGQLGEMATSADVGPPPFGAMIWLSIILIPVSALFSAVCLALAAFARSTKEGQYYLMPVILVTMPLILLPMAPSAELDLGFSLIPVSGIVLLMRSIMEGTIGELWPYAFPVMAVTFACCWLSVRWAVEQFRSEEVLFREGERWDLGVWLKHLMHDRQPTPTVALAVLCGVLILIVKFFMGSAIDIPKTVAALNAMPFGQFVSSALVAPLAAIASVALIMTWTLTRSPRQTLQLKRPPLLAVPAAALLAVCLLPMVMAGQVLITKIYAPAAAVHEYLAATEAKLNSGPSFLLTLLLVALLPAICEELAFRGFILTGFRHSGRKWRAIVLTSVFFGIAHSLMHQQINAFFLGLLLGYIAIQADSIWPAIVYHCVHNGTAFTLKKIGVLEEIIASDVYAGAALFFGTLLGVGLIFWFHQLHYTRTEEEQLRETIERESAQPLPS